MRSGEAIEALPGAAINSFVVTMFGFGIGVDTLSDMDVVAVAATEIDLKFFASSPYVVDVLTDAWAGAVFNDTGVTIDVTFGLVSDTTVYTLADADVNVLEIIVRAPPGESMLCC